MAVSRTAGGRDYAVRVAAGVVLVVVGLGGLSVGAMAGMMGAAWGGAWWALTNPYFAVSFAASALVTIAGLYLVFSSLR